MNTDMQLSVNGQPIPVDSEGFLKNLSDWDHHTAQALALQESITLTEQHWEIIHLLRKFYQQYQLSPAMRPLIKFIKQELGQDKGNSMHLLKLFPGSPAKLASKIAGLPKPDNCL